MMHAAPASHRALSCSENSMWPVTPCACRVCKVAGQTWHREQPRAPNLLLPSCTATLPGLVETDILAFYTHISLVVVMLSRHQLAAKPQLAAGVVG